MFTLTATFHLPTTTPDLFGAFTDLAVQLSSVATVSADLFPDTSLNASMVMTASADEIADIVAACDAWMFLAGRGGTFRAIVA